MPLITEALTSLATARSHLSIPASDTSQNARLELLINAATQRLETMTDRALKERLHVELRSGRRTNILMLKQWPVTNVTGLYFDDQSLFGPETAKSPSSYVIGDEGHSLILKSDFFPNGFHNIKVEYTAGYNANAHAGVLAELELACLWLVEWFYRHRERGDMGRTSKSKGDESVGILAEMPTMIQEIILDHKRTEAPLLDRPLVNL
jgi:uncharacterized phiE125 gp8 family phage protein